MLKKEARDISKRFGFAVVVLTFIAPGLTINVSYAQESSTHDSNSYAYNLVNSMARAHGGKEQWMSKSVMKFTSEGYQFHTSLPQTGEVEFADLYHYEVAIKPANSIGYASFSKDARIYFDGTDIWTIGLTDENNNLDKSPVILLFFTYSLINLPWLAQMDGINLEYAGTGMLPLEEDDYHIVRLTFGSEFEHQHEGYYELYIDQHAKLLRGVKQTAILPELPETEFHLGVPSLPTPILHIFKSYEVIDDLVIPSSYVSYQQGKLLGINFVKELSVDGDLDKALINPSHPGVVAKDFVLY